MELDDASIVNWLNAIESEYDLVVYLADQEAYRLDAKAIRQADQLVILVAYGAAACGSNPVEEIGLVCPPRKPPQARAGSRPPGAVYKRHGRMAARARRHHDAHHVSLEDEQDFTRLYRFLTGRAVGFVAGGGGGFGPAHVGIFKAFEERGAKFDILGGASVGAAVLAGFALLLTPAELDLALNDIFVSSRGFKRHTFPRYALLDHVEFDKALQRQCRGAQIEDAWLPYFAVATDVDRAGQEPLYHATRSALEGSARV